MYKYNAIDQQLVDDRVEQFRDQTRRFLAGELSEEAYLPLRLMNGLYIQRHAPMLRVAIPYGLLATYQLRKLADISEKYDRGYGHITTRTNMQFNWPKLEEVPDILAELASVQMHAIQTSGNCIRNTTTDQFAGVTADEIADPRPYCEIIRQWSTFHPEFTYLPRKFKIAVIGTRSDRAATQLHDIGLHVVTNDAGDIGFEVIVGGGLGRTPVIGKVIRPFLPERHLLSYLDAILRIYNQYGRRDNKYKARIKILVESMGAEEFSRIVEEDWEKHNKDGALTLTAEQIEHAKTYFPPPAYQTFSQQQLQASQDKLAAQFESGKEGISAIGYDRRGGTSYGKYQIASRPGSMDNFISYLKTEAPDIAKQLEAAGPANTGSRSGRMPDVWREIAASQPERFGELQEGFIRDSHYKPAMEAVKKAGFNADNFSPALQEVLFSTAVQHGPNGAARIFTRAAQQVGLKAGVPHEQQFIKEVYAKRAGQFENSTAQVREAVHNRLHQEKNMALAMVGNASIA